MLATEAQPSAQILATVAEQGMKAPASAESVEGWQFVWCHERCHKVDLEPLRASFAETVEKANGTLMCLKKATGFGRWLSRMPNVPFVLLADWREAKPCWDVLSQEMPNQLQFTLVYTEQERQFKQASQWAATLRARGGRNAIHVVPSHIKNTELADYVVRMLQRNKAMVCPAGMRRIASHPGTPCEGMRRVTSSPTVSPCEGIRRVSSFPGCQPEALSPTSAAVAGPPPGVWATQSPQSTWACKSPAWPRDVQIDQSMEWEAMQQWPQDSLECDGEVTQGQYDTCKALPVWPLQSPQQHKDIITPCSPMGAQSPSSFVDTEAAKWAKPVAAVLSSIFKSESWEDIQSALQLSEPDYYED